MPPSCDDLDAVIDRAHRAQRRVSALSYAQRVQAAVASGRALADHTKRLVEIAVAETGTTAAFARREATSARLFVEAVPTLAEALMPVEVPARSGRTVMRWEPYGVVAGWHAANSPIWVPTLVALSALVGGNVVVSRPSRRAARTTRAVLEAVAAAWPQDAVQVADLDPAQGHALIAHPRVNAVVAHASTATCVRHMGVLAQAYASGVTMRPYIPEASGNDAAVVLPGADLERAAAAIAMGAFANAGQLCMAAKRIIVDCAVWDAFVGPLCAAVEAIDADPEHATHVQNGTSVYEAGMRALRDAHARGGEVIVGGQDGEVLRATVVRVPADAVHGALLWQQEVFAPVRSLVVCDGVQEALRLANDSRFGLGAALFGGDAGARELFTRGVRASRVVVDEGPLYQDPHLVVGGVGDSGYAGARPKLEQLVWAKRVHWADGATCAPGG